MDEIVEIVSGLNEKTRNMNNANDTVREELGKINKYS